MWPPEKQAGIRISGGSTLKTFSLPIEADRVQYILQGPTDRPIRAKVELWIGPLRCVHEMSYDCDSGMVFPIKVTLKFKKGVAPNLKISTNDTQEFPLLCGVFMPSPEENERLAALTDGMFYSAPMKEVIRGGDFVGSKAAGGAIRNFNIDPAWRKTQIMAWSGDVGKKSFNSDIDFFQGPSNPKMTMKVRCGGSTQPFHCVFETPGGGVLRVNSKKFVEDGQFEIAVAPYEIGGPVDGPNQYGGNHGMTRDAAPRTMNNVDQHKKWFG